MNEYSGYLTVGGGFSAALAGTTAAWIARRGRRMLARSRRPKPAPGDRDAAGIPAAWPTPTSRRQRMLDLSEVFLYRLAGPTAPADRYVGIVCGDLRRVHCAEVWVNSENTGMQMARVDEFSISSIIRYEGAVRDGSGKVVHDRVAEELARRTDGTRPVAPGTAVVTGPGELRRNGVRHIVHVAAVQGAPGAGFRQIAEVGTCVTNALAAVDGIETEHPARSVLFPMLGVGQGGGELEPTIRALLGAAVDYLTTTPDTRVTTVYLLAYSDVELEACQAVFAATSRLRATDTASRAIGAAAAAEGPDASPAAPGRPTGSAAAAGIAVEASAASAPKKLQIGFVVDVIGYGTRSALSQEALQHRLRALIAQVLADCGTSLDAATPQWAGDGGSAFLPADIDPTAAVPTAIRSVAGRMAEDNRRHEDRMRLRMAMGVGIIGPGAAGLTGPMIVHINRLVDSPPLRAAAREHPTADLVLLVSDHLHAYVIRPGYLESPATAFQPVEISVKEFEEQAWLWVSGT